MAKAGSLNVVVALSVLQTCCKNLLSIVSTQSVPSTRLCVLHMRERGPLRLPLKCLIKIKLDFGMRIPAWSVL